MHLDFLEANKTLKKFLNMASAKIAKVKKQTTTPKKPAETETDDGPKLSDYEILTTIGKICCCYCLLTAYSCP